jgi:hypothetical protein
VNGIEVTNTCCAQDENLLQVLLSHQLQRGGIVTTLSRYCTVGYLLRYREVPGNRRLESREKVDKNDLLVEQPISGQLLHFHGPVVEV